MYSTQKRSQVFLWCLLGCGALVMCMPFLWLIVSTFKKTEEIMGVPPTFLPKEWTFKNYIDTITTFNIMRYFGNSVFLASVKTGIVLYTSLLCGYVFAKFQFQYKNALFSFVLFTMMVPYLIMVIPLYEMMNAMKLIDSYIAVILPSLYFSFGIFMMKQYMEKGVPDELLEAARIEGASEFAIFHRIAIPLSASMIAALGIFLFLWNWEDFLWPYLVLSTEAKFPLAVALNFFKGKILSSTVACLPPQPLLLCLCYLYTFFVKNAL